MKQKKPKWVRLGIYPEKIGLTFEGKITHRLTLRFYEKGSRISFFSWNGVPYELGVTQFTVAHATAGESSFIAIDRDFLAVGSNRIAPESDEAGNLANSLGYASFEELIEDRMKGPMGLPFIGHIMAFEELTNPPVDAGSK